MKLGGRTLILVCVLLFAAACVSVAAFNLPAAPSSAPAPDHEAPAASPEPTPAPRVVEVRDASSEAAPAPDYDGAVALVTVNRAFGDALYDDNALVDSVEITLLDRAIEIDGFRYLERDLVQDAVRRRYGREVSPDAGAVYGMEPPEGYYAILPRSYDYHEQTVTDVQEREDGTLLVTSQLLVIGLDSSDVRRVETVLSPADNDYGYVIVSADVVG